MSEAIMKALAGAMTVAIHAMAKAAAEQPHGTVGPKIGTPAMKQSTFNWDADNKYSE